MKERRIKAEQDYDRRQVEHLQTVIDRLNSQLAAANARADEAERENAAYRQMHLATVAEQADNGGKPLSAQMRLRKAEKAAWDRALVEVADRARLDAKMYWESGVVSASSALDNLAHTILALRDNPAPYHTDLMVDPETIDAFMEANLLPDDKPAPAVTVEDSFSTLVAEARAEAEKAMRKFPQPNYVLLKVAEEAGEVVKAAVHFAEGRETVDNVRSEMRQTIAMLYRLWIEGDEVNGVRAIAGGGDE